MNWLLIIFSFYLYIPVRLLRYKHEHNNGTAYTWLTVGGIPSLEMYTLLLR